MLTATFVFVVIFCGASFGLNITKKPSIYYLHIQSDVRYRFATTLVTSRVVNPANTAAEAKFDVTLPDEAFISDFQMEIGGRIYPGEVNEKVTAQKKYDTAKKRGQSAGQVKQKPRQANRFSVEVNVAAGEKVTFNLTYQELLKRKQGSYEHIIYINPRQIVKDFKIDISIKESRDITKVNVPPLRNDLKQVVNATGQNALAVVERPTKQSATIRYYPTESDQRKKSEQGLSGLFVVEYDIARPSDAGDVLVVNGYFVHFFAPKGMGQIPKDVIVILDVSSSMSGIKIRQMKTAMLRILKELNDGDRFNIMKFDSRIKFWKQNVISANSKSIAEASTFINNMAAGGYTNINQAMLGGINFLRNIKETKGRSQLLLFLTDGQPSAGVTNVDTILKNVQRANNIAVPVYSLAFGRGADYEFVKKVAVQNDGLSRKIYEDSDAEWQIKGFYDEISAAVLKNVSFKYMNDDPDIANVTRVNFNTFFSGSEIVVAGKMEDNTIKIFDLSVKGQGSKGFVELALAADVKSSAPPELTKAGDYAKITEKIWAYLTIKQILEKSIGETDATEKSNLKKRALDLSLKYKFVTPLTSMVVTKPDERDVGNLDEGDDAKLARQGGQQSVARQGGQQSSGSAPTALGSSRRSSGGSSGGYSRGGGGGGDPHFMIRISGLSRPLCFDIHANPGSVMSLLSDPKSGLTINAAIIASPKYDRSGRLKTFIGELLIRFRSHLIAVTPTKIIFDGAELSWENENPFSISGITTRMMAHGVTIRVMHIDFGNNVEILIKRIVATPRGGVDYLNVYIDNEKGLSRKAGGVLGQFVHRKIKLRKMKTNHKKQTIGILQIKEKGFRTTKSRTMLVKRNDTITGIGEPCWNAHTKVAGLFDKSVNTFFIQDLMQT